jgi:hypothetical protein
MGTLSQAAARRHGDEIRTMRLHRCAVVLVAALAGWIGCGKGAGGTASRGAVPDAGAPDAGVGAVPTAALLEPGATRIHAISPDRSRILVSHGLPPADLALVTIGGPTKTLERHEAGAGEFSPDGRAIVFNTRSRDEPYNLHLARGDGSGSRKLTTRSAESALSGSSLYYADGAAADILIYQVVLPDGKPELLATFPAPHELVSVSPSPGGESVVYCHSQELGSDQCFLLSPTSVTPRPLAHGIGAHWAPDGSWLLASSCELIDRSGQTRKICDDAPTTIDTLLPTTIASPDGRLLAVLSGRWPPAQESLRIHVYDVQTATDLAFSTPGPFDGTVFRPAVHLRFTPDGSRLIAELGDSLFTAPSSGGSWIEVSADGAHDPGQGTLAVSPDSHIVAITGSHGVVESIDGGPPRAVAPPDGPLSQGTQIIFEPAGLHKALFVDFHGGGFLSGGDGSGEWMLLRDVDNCQWSGRTALCVKGHSSSGIVSFDLSFVTDDGKQAGTVATDVAHWSVAGDQLFYVPNSGGLYRVQVPQP